MKRKPAVAEDHVVDDCAPPEAQAVAQEVAFPASRPSALRLTVLALAVCLLIIGQTYLLRGHLMSQQGKVVFAVGLLVAWAAFAASGRLHHAASPRTTQAARPAGVRSRALALFSLAAFLGLVAAALTARRDPNPDAPLVWVLALCLFVAGLIIRYRAQLREYAPLWPKKVGVRSHVLEIAALAAILYLGVWVRVTNLADIPAYIEPDEAGNGVAIIATRDGRMGSLFEATASDQTRLSLVPAALLMKLPGDLLLSERLSSVLTSLLTLAVFYPLARMYVSRPVALLAVFLLAAAALDIVFSRMGIMNVQASLLAVAGAYFFLRTLRGRRGLDAALCGAVIGLTTYAYFNVRVVPLTIAVVFLFALAKDRRAWREYVRLGAIMALAGLLVAAPQIGYYLAHPQSFFGHTVNYTWWNHPGMLPTGLSNPSFWQLLGYQIDRALWGFTYYFETSAHFVNDTRLLDFTTGILFALGVIACLRRWRQPKFFLLLALYLSAMVFISVLSAGTPHAPRLTVITPALCLFAAIAVQQMLDIVQAHGLVLRAASAAAAFVLVPVFVLTSNYQVIFQRYAGQNAYQLPTLSARYLQASRDHIYGYILGDEVDPRNSPAAFLAPGAATAMPTWEESLPVRQAQTRDVAFISGQNYLPALDIVRDYYPQGTLEETKRPDSSVAMAVYRVQGQDISALQGLSGAYRSLESGATADRKDANIDFVWDGDCPPGINSPFAATWDGSLYAAEYATYTLRLEGDGKVALSLDGVELMDTRVDQTASDATVTLARGWHPLHLDYETAGGDIRLLWARDNEPPRVIGPEFFSVATETKGLRTRYYSGASTAGPPAIESIEPAIFGRTNIYRMRRGNQPYVVTHSGSLTASEPGLYRFAALAVDGDFQLKIDGQEIITFPAGVRERREGQATLAAGKHLIDVLFRSPSGRTDVQQLWWAPPGQPLSPIPPSTLSPVEP